MSSTRSHSDGSSGDDDELALRIALERSWVNTGGSSGDEVGLALRIALARSWVKYGRQLRVRCDAICRPSPQETARPTSTP